MTAATARAEQLTAFYDRHADRLQRIVRANVHAPEQTVEDACQNAWAILLRRDDITLDAAGANWLTTVAIREGWRLASRANETPVGTFQGDPRGHDDTDEPEPADTLTPDTAEQALARVEHAQRVADLRTLKPRERRELYLRALGYEYKEICTFTGSTYTAVNRRLAEGRTQLSRLGRERRDRAERGEPEDRDDDDERGETSRPARPTPGMTIQPITYRGRTVAAATRERFFLTEALDRRPAGDPDRTIVIFMCAYAGDVLSGVLPGPYRDADARRYARACLVSPELLEHPGLDLERAARAMQIPVDELRAARAEYAPSGTPAIATDRTRAGESVTPGRQLTITELLAALSDTPLTGETYAWIIGRTRDASVLELRLAALLPDAQLVRRSDGVAAWASRRHNVTIVYWLDDGVLELTLDEDLEQAITTILNDIAPAGSSVRPAAGDPHEPPGDRSQPKRYGDAVSQPVITRVVAIEELPPGSPATRRLIAAWSDGTQSEALAWFSDEWLVSEGDLVALTRDEVRALADRQWLRDAPPDTGDQQPFFGS